MQAFLRYIQSKGTNLQFQHYNTLLYGMAFVSPAFVEEAFETLGQPHSQSRKDE
jgi:hypothetical protein